MRPGADDFKTGDQWLTGAAVVEVLKVHDLEARFAHEAFGIEIRVLREACGGDGIGAFGMPFAYFAVSAATGTSISSLRITKLVAFKVASSKPCPCVIASVGQASTQ